jgi:cyclopropane-fatty-acyl-phospholipid synthase
MPMYSDRRRIEAARRIFAHVAKVADLPFTLRLWDGSSLPLGRQATAEGEVTISGVGVLSSLLRRPSLDSLFRHYVTGQIDFQGPDLIACIEVMRGKRKAERLRARDFRR